MEENGVVSRLVETCRVQLILERVARCFGAVTHAQRRLAGAMPTLNTDWASAMDASPAVAGESFSPLKHES
jgi:hypothetical protein